MNKKGAMAVPVHDYNHSSGDDSGSFMLVVFFIGLVVGVFIGVGL